MLRGSPSGWVCHSRRVNGYEVCLTMSRAKRSSRILEQAERRAAAMRSIDANLDLGNGLKLADYNQLIQAVREDIAAYNETLSLADKGSHQVKEGERKLRDLTELMLVGVAAKYGKNSAEYEMAGGTRKSARKKPVQREGDAV